MRSNQRYLFFLVLFFLSILWPQYCQATASGLITQRVHLECILNEENMGWSGRGSPYINEITASEDGGMVAFIVTLGNPWEKRLYIMYMGLNPLDITASLPGPVDSGFKVNSLQLNHDGSRLFFVWSWLTDIYYYDGGVCQPVVEEISRAQTEKPYAINSNGTRVFFRDTRWSETQQKHISGMYYADVGGNPQLIFDYEDLPCEHDPLPCHSWYSRLKFLDCSPDGSTVFFRWVIGESAYDKQSMFKVAVGGSPEMYPPEEHDGIWPSGLRNRIVSESGDAVLYEYYDTGEPRKLFILSSGQKTLIGETTDGNGFAYLSLRKDDGSVRFYARSGFMHTIWSGGLMRDSFSELIQSDGDPFPGKFMATDLIADGSSSNSAYFTATRSSGVDLIHKVRINRPYDPFRVEKIYYDRLPLLIDDKTPLTVYAKVAHSLGLEHIEWVRMHSLVEGVEYKDWHLVNPDWNNTPPIYYNIELYDDGSNGGDAVANDGIYTNNTIRHRPDSGFYNKYRFPAYPGIRIVAKDTLNEYAIADSYIEVREEVREVINIGVIPQLLLTILGQ